MAIQARHFRQWFAFLLLLALGGTAAWFLMPREWSQMQWEIPGTPSEYPLAQLLRPWLILLGCFLPALGMLLYNRSGILDRYVARTWFTAFIMCTAILTLIYIIGDFADNVGDLMNLDSPLAGTFRFYLSQLPMILNLILPYTLLLGTLWALTKLSSSSEITGMLQSGRSLLRINAPVIIGAVFAAIYFGIFGFHWAPNSTLYRKLMFSSLSQNKNDDASRSTIYKNDAESRIWYLGDPPGIDSPGEPFRQVRVEQFSAPGKMEYELFADEAMWDPASRTWTFRQAIKRNYSQEEPRPAERRARVRRAGIPNVERALSRDSLAVDFPQRPRGYPGHSGPPGNHQVRHDKRQVPQKPANGMARQDSPHVFLHYPDIHRHSFRHHVPAALRHVRHRHCAVPGGGHAVPV